MKIIVTGSLGHISKPLTRELVQKGHEVIVISSSPERKDAIEALGAKAAIGTMEDAGFLTATFTGADAVYVMEAMGGNSYYSPLGCKACGSSQQHWSSYRYRQRASCVSLQCGNYSEFIAF